MLSLLLARAGVPVTLLEAHRDFERDFRGDTIHPATLEVLAQIGLAERLHQLPHVKATSFKFISPRGTDTAGVFSRLPTPFPYIMIMPQARFLEFLVEEAKRYPHFRLLLGAHVDALLEDGGAVRGVGYRSGESRGEVRAALTVAADGRFSRVRKLARLEPVSKSVRWKSSGCACRAAPTIDSRKRRSPWASARSSPCSGAPTNGSSATSARRDAITR